MNKIQKIILKNPLIIQGTQENFPNLVRDSLKKTIVGVMFQFLNVKKHPFVTRPGCAILFIVAPDTEYQ